MTTSTAQPPRRASCSTCMRPLARCLCGCVRMAAWHTEVLVLQHPLEVGHAKGTGWLLSRCLPKARVLVGEAWAPEELAAWLHGPWPHQAGHGPGAGEGALLPVTTALLYPEVPASPGQAWDKAEPPSRLVVLDATWRKSLKMLLLNPPLAALPRVSLQPERMSAYAIRRAHRPHQLSTLEATHLALSQLHPEASDEALEQAMAAFVASQRDWWPHAQRDAQEAAGGAAMTLPGKDA